MYKCSIVHWFYFKKAILLIIVFYYSFFFEIPLFYAQQEITENKKEQPKNTDVILDPNHTHFILVDDGSEGQFGKEIEFRAHLEAELRKGRPLKYYEAQRNKKKYDEIIKKFSD